jgi:integrase/recombinase XerC/integrase/recombinase XerD
MGTLHKLPAAVSITPQEAARAYLATISHAESAGTKRVYGAVLRRFVGHFTGVADVGALDGAEVTEWFTSQWGQRAPDTWNTALSAIRAATAYWGDQGWLTTDPAAALRRRRPRPDRSRALDRAAVEELLAREDIPLRERALWRMLYETAARAVEVLRLDVPDLDMPNRRAKVRRKGGQLDTIVWQTGTARLLPRLLKGRKSGPLFLTERRARVELPPGDVDPARGRARLSYRQAEDLFKAATGGATLHQLRHSALTHDAEDGVNTAMLQARSGHTTVRSLARYTRISAEALARHQAERDPARRR